MDNAVMSIRMKNWSAVMKAQAASGMSKTGFCRDNSISESSFFRWQRKIRQRLLEEQGLKRQSEPIDTPTYKEDGSFFELAATSSSSMTTSPDIDQLELCSPPEPTIPSPLTITYKGFSVNISEPISSDALTTVLKAVKNV